MKINEDWRLLCGDVNPLAYGAVYVRKDGDAFETLEIRPVAEYVGASDARDVGFPLWTVAAYFDRIDLIAALSDERGPLVCIGATDLIGRDLATLSADELTTLVYACHAYGMNRDNGPCGWARDLDILFDLGISDADREECDEEFQTDIMCG